MIRLLVVLCISFLAFSCRKERVGQIPDVPVNQRIYTSDPAFFPLNVVGGYTYFNGGSRGLLIYRRSNEEFITYDRHCPYDLSNPCGIVEVTSNGFAIVDSCCGSAFQIYDGLVSKGPAQYPLKVYQTTFNGNYLSIYN